MISIAEVNKHYGDYHALRDINLEIPAGQVVVILGPSGSGKSTLCRTINRLETIDSGEIRINGKLLPEEGKELTRPVSYTHLTLPTIAAECRSRWSPYH